MAVAVGEQRAPAPAVASDSVEQLLASVASLTERGRFGSALALIDSRLAAASDDDLLFARASLLFSWWRYEEAHALLRQLEDSGRARGADFYAKLGWTCFWLGRTEEAVAWMRKAVAIAPNDWATHFGLAIALRGRKRPAASRAEFEHVLALKPDDVHARSNLVACDIELGHAERAERIARAALERDPQSSSALIDLGIVLCEQGIYDEAVAAFERADAMGFADEDARDESVNYAICLLRAGRVQQAASMMENKLRRYPSAALHSHYALALLGCGRLREGFQQYEFRWLQEPLLSWRPKCATPVWSGQELRGKTILLRAEQGYGDLLQFIRYAKQVKALGPTVVLQVRDELREIAMTMAGIDRVLHGDEAPPQFDYHIHLLGLPRIFGTDLTTIPAEVPYLRADPARVARFREGIVRDGKLNVGIVFAGSPTHLGDRFRSLSLRALAPLRMIGGCRFYSLQKGPPAAELVTDVGFEPIVDLGPQLATFADTAAAVDALDLIISVDTAIVHLAGALGKPIWTLVAIPGDWRWLQGRDDTPWYPTMRLFRQRRPGGWDEVIARLTSALAAAADEHRRRGAIELAAAAPLQTSSLDVADNNDSLCRVAETRVGIIMYAPVDKLTATSIQYYGECRQKELESLLRLLAPGMIAMEVGAGIGEHSVPIATALGSEGHLFIYEDDGLLKQVLHENLRSNRITNATVMRRTLTVENTDASESIDELRLVRLQLLRINERADAATVLHGAQTTLTRLRPRIWVGVADGDDLTRTVPVLRACQYSCWRIETPLFNPSNFNARDIDVFGGRTSLSIVGIPEELKFDAAREWERIG